MCFSYETSTPQFFAVLHCAALCDELIHERTVCLNLLFQPHVDAAAGIPKCCIRTKMNIPARLLVRVDRLDMQQSSGACDIDALL